MEKKQNNNRLLYLPVGESDEDWGVVVSTVGSQLINPLSLYPPVQHPDTHRFNPAQGRVINEYQLVYITRGKGWFLSHSVRKKQKVTPGTMILLFPGEWHSYAPDSSVGWNEYWVGFRGSFIDKRVEKGFFTREDPLHQIGVVSTITELYEDIIRIAQKEKTAYQQMISSIVLSMLGTVYYKNKNRHFIDNHIVEKINQAREIIKQNTYNNILQEDVAKQIGLGYSWYRRMFKAYTGVSPAQYHLQQKLSKAKELLTTSGKNISEISDTLHFENISQFSTFFRNKEGVTPSEFRKRAH